MSIIDICALIALGFSIAYMIHMKAKMDEAMIEMKRASVRMRQLEDEISELSEDAKGTVSLQITDI